MIEIENADVIDQQQMEDNIRDAQLIINKEL